MSDLTRYDAACLALSAAVTADEVMSVHLSAKAIEAVGRVANNLDLELNARKLRVRAEVRLGEMLDEGERTGIISSHGGNNRKTEQGAESEPCSRATLKQIGIDKKLSARARKLNGIGARAVEGMLTRMEQESRAGGRMVTNVIEQEIGKRNTASRRNLAQELSDATALSRPPAASSPCLYADPAWTRKAGIGNRAYENTYVDHVVGRHHRDAGCAAPAARCMGLFLWIPRRTCSRCIRRNRYAARTNDGQDAARWAVAQAWGFDAYSTCFIWTKTDDEHPDDHGSA
jgi:hypothetical protein